MIARRQAVQGLLLFPLAACEGASEGTGQRVDPKLAPPRAVVRRKSGLVELIDLDPTILLDIRYATPNNFTRRILYSQPRAFLVEAAAAALLRVHRAARAKGYGVTIYDAYRPWAVTKKLWDATAPANRNFVANPKVGSKHNRGCAVDMTLHRLSDGAQLPMPSGYDEFSRRAHRNYTGGTAEQRANRALLQSLMEAHGFRGMSNEWWHFDFTGWERYPILDIPFEKL